MRASTTPSVTIPPESTVVEIWERQLFGPSALRMLGLSVVYRGTPSDCGGPDYRDALLARDQRHLVRGDVEFHSRSSDWYAHGHHRNPNYNAVVLHVVWTDDSAGTITQLGESVPVLELEPCVPTSFLTLSVPIFSVAPYRCASRLTQMPRDDMWERIRALGNRRLRARADRIAAEIEDTGADQTLYANLLEALGLAGNREGFRQLAEAVPLAWLLEADPSDRTAALLCAAGFASSPSDQPPARLPADTWRLSGLRPGNHPVQRIPAIAVLLDRLIPGFANAAVTRVLDTHRAADLVNFLVVRSERTTPLGPGRAREMVASMLLPFVYARTDDERVLDLFARAPAPPSTRWTRAFARLLDEPHTVRTAAEHQGIHELYVQHCRWEQAATCPVCGDLRV